MNNLKYYLCIIIWTFIPKMAIAVDLELSDVIREARLAQMKIAKSQIKENVEQTKNNYKEQQKGEQSATETISNDEIKQLEQLNTEK